MSLRDLQEKLGYNSKNPLLKRVFCCTSVFFDIIYLESKRGEKMYVWIIILLCLGYAAYKDFKTYEVPIELFALTTVVITIIKLFTTDSFDWVSSLLGTGMCFIVYLILAMFCGGGGGDIIMMSMLGWCLGARTSVYIILFSSFIYFIALIVHNDKKKKLPYAPGVFVGTLAISIINGFGI